jgi:hypothetical protein
MLIKYPRHIHYTHENVANSKFTLDLLQYNNSKLNILSNSNQMQKWCEYDIPLSNASGVNTILDHLSHGIINFHCSFDSLPLLVYIGSDL